MSNGTGNPGVTSRWDGGDLVFYAGDGTTELLRLGTAGTVAINGLTYPATDGSNGDVVTTDGDGTLSFTTPA